MNNDHLVSPDGSWHYASAQDGHIWQFPWDGGVGQRISGPKQADRRFRHYLHGISPDGDSIAFVGTEAHGHDPAGTRSLWIRNTSAGTERLLGEGFSPADGPEFSPDGRWLYFNSEIASTTPGHAQIFRSDLEGGHLEQLSFDERVNWFPHVSPDGVYAAYLSFPAGTVGHPPDRRVTIRLLHLETRATRDVVRLDGGQGTLNVNSWSPDSRRLAYVAYPFRP
ncbi:TolB family protein [Nakamurella panacisegetis]|uniref:TolB family protein n=1 Tax=Nakamurella panacisegetis TaxID=1090615 RepID=UPI0018D2D41A|nr:PD40 domain-containing protein [Nakamurella panacisegetis]